MRCVMNIRNDLYAIPTHGGPVSSVSSPTATGQKHHCSWNVFFSITVFMLVNADLSQSGAPHGEGEGFQRTIRPKQLITGVK